MSIEAYLTTAPLFSLARGAGRAAQNAVRFVGTPKKHPYDEGKCLLVSNPLEGETVITEFRIEDIARVEEAVASVNERGEGVELVAVWVRKGSIGIRYEPFEVDDPPRPLRPARRE
jgi:inorganic pyrophosphatase